MEIIVAIALIWGTVKAGETAVEWASKWAKAAATKHWRSYAAKHPHPKTGRAGRAVGKTVSAGFHGGVAAGRGSVAGWRDGWVEGRGAGRSWWEQRTAGKATAQEADTSNVTPLASRRADSERPAGAPVAVRPARDRMPSRETVGATALADPAPMVEMGSLPDPDQSEIVIYHNNGEWTRHTTNDPDELARWQEAASRQANAYEIRDYDIYPARAQNDLATVHPIGGESMSISTATGGEVLTMDQLITELESVVTEAAGDLEDATADAQRAKEDAQRFELMVASLAGVDLDEQSLGDISALSECAEARQRAAQDRQAAAENMHARASTAITNVRTRHQQMQEAHDSTPHAADKAFYGH